MILHTSQGWVPATILTSVSPADNINVNLAWKFDVWLRWKVDRSQFTTMTGRRTGTMLWTCRHCCRRFISSLHNASESDAPAQSSLSGCLSPERPRCSSCIVPGRTNERTSADCIIHRNVGPTLDAQLMRIRLTNPPMSSSRSRGSSSV